jgi:glycerate 2-kinase
MSAPTEKRTPRILVAPDSFKGSISAASAALALARGVQRAAPGAIVDICPLADGGEGTLDALLVAKSGVGRTTRVSGPLGQRVTARWGSFADGLAVVEAAQAAGLELVPTSERDPGIATTFGVGELACEALESGASTLMITLGGTATMDLGSGMAQALGVEFDGGVRPMAGAALEGVRRIDTTRLDPRLKNVSLVVAVDVDNPLLGAEGAARTYGPQKGATPAHVEAFERGFSHVATLLGDPGDRPGDGAAGGAAYLLRMLLGAKVELGAGLVQAAVGFASRLADADLVVTGEGRLDHQTARGKVVCAVGRAAKLANVPVVAVAGAVRDDARPLYEEGVDAWFSICDGPLTEADARARAPALLEKVAENIVRLRFR